MQTISKRLPNADAISNALSNASIYSRHHLYSVMLDGVLGQQGFWLPLHTRLEWRPDEVVEEKRSVDQESKTQNLQPFEGLPA